MTEFPHNIARSPSPPIRYELKEDSNKKYGIKRHRGRDKKPRPSNPKEHSPSKTIERSREKMKPQSPVRINKPRVTTDDDDDNMSLISMADLIVDDVCRLKNCKYENIGPTNHNGKSNESKITDMNVSYKTQPKSKSQKQNQKAKGTKSKKHPSSSGVWVNKPTLLTDYQTSDTGSMTTRSLSRSPKQNRPIMTVNYESDTISEITPPRCAPFENNESGQKQSTPEETFRDFLSSVATCLPNASDLQHVQRSFSDAQTKFEITNTQGILFRNHITNQNLCNGPTLCQKNESTSGNKMDSMLLKHRANSFDDGSITSASSLPYFRNNSDRYNHLVNGRELAYMQAGKEGKQRKRFWFKSKRRNSTKADPPQHVTVPQNMHEPHGPCNMEGLWQQSRSFDENEKILLVKAKKQTKPLKEAKTPIFKKLLKRGKSKERKRLKDKQSDKQASTAAARSVMITAKDPTKWPPEKNDVLVSSCDDPHFLEASKCVASTIVTAVARPGETAMNVINSDVALALVGAPPASAVALAISDSKKRETAHRKLNSGEQKVERPTKDEVVTIGPVWRDNKPAPRALLSPETQRVPTTVTKSSKKSRPRCYHRNSDLLDDDFAPTLSWRQSRSYDSPTNLIAKKHSYSEDDFGQEDFKVVSIIGHDISSSELERYGSLNLSHNGGVTNTLLSDRHQQVFCQSRKRSSVPRTQRNKSRYSDGNNSPTSSMSYSTSSSSDSFSSDETTSSSSSSSPKRPIRLQSKPQTRVSRSRDLRPMHDTDDEYTSESEAAMEAALLATPWRNDYEKHMASKAKKVPGVPSIGPLEPPKIQRSALPHTSIPKISPPRKDVPMRKLLV